MARKQMHLQEHNDHSVQWQEVFYLEHEEDWKKRKVKEEIYINVMDSKEIMNLEKGFESNPCWNEFNPHIQNIAQKKRKIVNLNFPVHAFFEILYIQTGSEQSCVSISSV